MNKTVKSRGYICSVCGNQLSSWAGRCPQCGEWNTIEINLANTTKSDANPLVMEKLDESAKFIESRLSCTLEGINLVFGGGIVIGSVNLISGEPGMGKSTLLLQIAGSIAKNHEVLYVSGEESLHQIAMRAERLGIKASNLQLAANNSANDIAQEIKSKHFKLVIIDSIQTLTCNEIGSTAGSVSQVTNSASVLAQAAKQSNIAIIIVGHVTKEGSLAGPKLLEHIVDVVLSLEGDQSGGLKLLRVSKNRFGSTNETAIFEMKQTGLIGVSNPSAVLLEERKITDGSIVLATIEGSRPILVEVQALVNPTNYGYPKRAVSGLELNRLNLLIAMIERRTSLVLSDKDIYVNLVGGLKVSEPAADLAVAMSICSAAKGKKLNHNAVVFGELGLSGEVRHVSFIDKRLAEAKKMGFDYAIGPKSVNIKDVAYLKPVSELKSALNLYLN